MTTQRIRRQLRLAARALALAALIGAGPAAMADRVASATVTATPPVRASVKRPTPRQARQRCELEAHQQHIGHPQRQSFLQSCLKQKIS